MSRLNLNMFNFQHRATQMVSGDVPVSLSTPQAMTPKALRIGATYEVNKGVYRAVCSQCHGETVLNKDDHPWAYTKSAEDDTLYCYACRWANKSHGYFNLPNPEIYGDLLSVWYRIASLKQPEGILRVAQSQLDYIQAELDIDHQDQTSNPWLEAVAPYFEKMGKLYTSGDATYRRIYSFVNEHPQRLSRLGETFGKFEKDYMSVCGVPGDVVMRLAQLLGRNG